jgi:flagellar hook protein FlgE
MSFDIALSGIQAINEQLDTTSQNIANAGTYGYKAGRANFSALVAGSQPVGTQVSSITQDIAKSGGILNTGRALDVSINGRGFFIAKTPSGVTQYTRVGIFDTNKNGLLVDAEGRAVQGFPITPPATTLGALGNITVPTGQIPAVPSGKLAFTANMSADWTAPAVTWGGIAGAGSAVTPANPPDPQTFNSSQSTTIYDTLGTAHTLSQYFIATATPGTVAVQYVLDGTDLGAAQNLTFATTPVPPATTGSGQLTGAGPAAAAPFVVPLAITTTTAAGATFNTVNIDYTGTTLFAGKSTVSTNLADGYPSGVYSSTEIAADGSIVAKYSNNQSQTVGMLALATFPDEQALTVVDNTSWEASTASGTALAGVPGDGQAGNLNTTSLEQSNVDITSELVGMMTSQRNYQANSKVIQTESTMLQSLMQAI